MNKRIITAFILFISILVPSYYATGQEYAGSVGYNPSLNAKKAAGPTIKTAKKTTAVLSLPFFEDFTGYSITPDSSRWTDFEVFINNTMCVNPVTRGVATFDALNQIGLPYDSFTNANFRHADSLTSKPIDLDLATVLPGDSVYLSFFYQPQGNGFYPLYQDTLELYMKTRFGGYERIWTAAGSSLKPFKQVMIPITDSLYFHNAFQFRFVNIAALYWADAIWNLDYIRLDKNRNMNDTTVNDIGFAGDPTFLLNDYTSMPYRHFMANKAGETAPQYRNQIHNNRTVNQPATYGFTATALNTATSLQSIVYNSVSLRPSSISTVTNAAYTATIPMSSVSVHDKVVFENTFFIEPNAGTGSMANDTIVKQIVFDNYLAYDDGTAEKSYYLNLNPTLPGKISIEYHLNQPDTLQGMAIYFGRQIPYATYKSFSIQVFSQLNGVNGAVGDRLLLQQDLNSPFYVDTVNHFSVYRFDEPIVLQAGTFYAGTQQPASSGDDSIYFGLDVNRIGGNHAYYNVTNAWEPSLISGAIMMRPLLGQRVVSSGITDIKHEDAEWSIWPNPANDQLYIDIKKDYKATYAITDVQGRTVMSGMVLKNKSIDISLLTQGMYFVRIMADGLSIAPKKIVKQ